MANPPTFRCFVHTCWARLGKLAPTLESLDASDLAGKYEVLESPMFNREGGEVTEQWYKDTLVRLAAEPLPETGKPPDFVVRFEDDVIVNRYILHNLQTWGALRKSEFGLGVLFVWDQQWPPRPCMQRWDRDGNLCRLDLDICCAQGNVYEAKHVPVVMDFLERAQGCAGVGHGSATYDNATTRATRMAGKYVFLHLPSLVNCHGGSKESTFGSRGHSSDRTFDLNWKHGESRHFRRP